jgi:hypothetical protein
VSSSTVLLNFFYAYTPQYEHAKDKVVTAQYAIDIYLAHLYASDADEGKE